MSVKFSKITSEEHIYRKLVESPLYRIYRKAFMDTTGMGLALLPIDENMEVPGQEDRFLNPFCRQLNKEGSACQNCILAHRCLAKMTSDKAETSTCFAGMRETAIPIRTGGRTIALLVTGQIFTEEPKEEIFAAFAEQIERGGEDLEELYQTWSEGRVMSREQYHGAITLLAAFAMQLSELFNRLLIEHADSESGIVIKAKQFVNARLEDKIVMKDVSEHVGVSQFYFCKVFKQATGMTLTEYVNRRRIEWAKRELLNPGAPITEIAFDIGYQSLSQFNRSFLKYVGVSPTRYREKLSRGSNPILKVVA